MKQDFSSEIASRQLLITRLQKTTPPGWDREYTQERIMELKDQINELYLNHKSKPVRRQSVEA